MTINLRKPSLHLAVLPHFPNQLTLLFTEKTSSHLLSFLKISAPALFFLLAHDLDSNWESKHSNERTSLTRFPPNLPHFLVLDPRHFVFSFVTNDEHHAYPISPTPGLSSIPSFLLHPWVPLHFWVISINTKIGWLKINFSCDEVHTTQNVPFFCGLNCVLPNPQVKALTPKTSNVTVFEERLYNRWLS